MVLKWKKKLTSEQAETKTDLLEHTKPNKNCSTCDHYNDYICFDCESMQIKDKYPNAIYNDDCEWVLKWK